MLMKATTADRYREILVKLYHDALADELIEDVKSGKRKVLQVRNALSAFLEGKEGLEHHEEIPGTKERAERVLEAIKDIKTGRLRSGKKTIRIEELIAQFKAGKFDPLFDYINDAKSKNIKSKRKKKLIKFKDDLLSIAKKIQDDELRASTIKRLEAIDWVFKEGTKEYKLTGKPSPQKIVEYYTLVFSIKSNLSSANRNKMIPKVGAANIFGSKMNILYPVLEHIILEDTFILDDELLDLFRKQKTKQSISKKKALINLTGGNIPDLQISNLPSLSEEATGLTEKEALKLIESDEKYVEAFDKYVNHIGLSQKSISRSIPKEDYDALENESDDVAREYGFEDFNDWDNWMDSKAGRNVAWDAMVEKNNRMVIESKKLSDVKLLSNMFTEADIDVKGSISEASGVGQLKASLNDNKFDNHHLKIADVIEMLANLAEVFEATDFDFSVMQLLQEKDETNLKELVEEIIDDLEKGDYQRIRMAFLNATIQRMEGIASKSILLAEDEDEDIAGQKEPLNILRELGLLQAVNV